MARSVTAALTALAALLLVLLAVTAGRSALAERVGRGAAVDRLEPHPEVRTGAGILRGIATNLEAADPAAAFLGIPYASPPVGPLRWRPPEPPVPWEGVRDATSLTPACPQPPFRADFFRRVARRLGGDPEAVPDLGVQHEDCLHLNVWTPEHRPGADLPVLVWIHGGSGTIGTAMVPLFDGRRLASRGAVVVAVNYRLGPLGFLAHPALSAESPPTGSLHGTSGNWALLDLVRALEWVRDEIGAFGGNPDRVVLVGQSAGAGLASHLLAAPMAEDLFHGVILQSGTGLGLALPGDARAADPDGRVPPRTGESVGRALARAVGVDTAADPAGVVRALRAVPPDRLIEAGLAAGATPDRPVIDGHVVPGALHEVLARGERSDVPVIVGTNSLEAAVLIAPPASVEAYRQWVEDTYGTASEEVLALYPASDSAGAARAVRLLATDEWLAAPARRTADLLARAGHSVWLYRFDRSVPAPRGEEVGAFHGAEMPFLFGNFPDAWNPAGGVGPGPADLAFSELLADTWIRFAATGDPNGGPPLPYWPPHRPGVSRAIFLRDEPVVAPLPRPRALDLFDERAGGG